MPTRLAVWVPTAVDPEPAAVEQIRRAVVAYLAAPGYGEMFERAGFGDLVARARSGDHPGELLAAVPDALVETVGALGDVDEVADRIAAYAAAGADEVVIVPSATDADPGGARTLRSLADRLDVRSAPAAARA
jgi:alkanesulfonate monooxygenase SsuD/methylene tetrahydromethanopterin reductase-like flavin-dependent oxidoreductase (luciferase family)